MNDVNERQYEVKQRLLGLRRELLEVSQRKAGLRVQIEATERELFDLVDVGAGRSPFLPGMEPGPLGEGRADEHQRGPTAFAGESGAPEAAPHQNGKRRKTVRA